MRSSCSSRVRYISTYNNEVHISLFLLYGYVRIAEQRNVTVVLKIQFTTYFVERRENKGEGTSIFLEIIGKLFYSSKKLFLWSPFQFQVTVKLLF